MAASLALWLTMVILVTCMVQESVTDGAVDHLGKQFLLTQNTTSFLSSESTCEHMYGFLPCSENIGGHLFQVVLYQYLMIIGGQLVAEGSKTLFTMLGTGIFGATLFRVLLNFPRISFAIMSGMFSTQEEAQRQVSLSVGIYTGSSVLVLTVLWGIVSIVGKKKLSEDSSCGVEPSVSTPLLDNKDDMDMCSQLKETGVKTDEKTSHTAGIMILSLIPYFVAQLVNIFNTSTGSRVIILSALVVSAASLLSYFIYQLWDPWIQERSLEYSKYQNLVSGFLKYVRKQAKGKLIDSNGQPNIPIIERLFSQHDQNADRSLTSDELQKLIGKFEGGEVQVDKDYAVSQVLRIFDINSDGRISEDEFVEGSKKWIEESKKLGEENQNQNNVVDSTKRESIDQVIQQYTKKRRDELVEIEGLMGNIMKRVRSEALQTKWPVKEDGELNIQHFQTLFKQFSSGENSISKSELQQLIKTVKYGEAQAKSPDQTAISIMSGFDKDGNNEIDEREFIIEAKKFLNESAAVQNGEDTKRSTGQVDWDEVDNLIYKVQANGTVAWAYGKPILQILLGVVMLTLVSKAFMSSLVQFSVAIGMDTFFLGFVIIPIVMNASTLMSAITPALDQKCTRTISLTYSEIYGDVIMNNVMGLTSILAIIYAKDLPWDYSVEVVIVVAVCGIVGFFALFTTTYPFWTTFFAFFLYLFSLALSNVVHYVWGWN